MGPFEAVLAIVLIDLALSGDNALVIGMAARTLPPRQRRAAIILGGAGAVLLRIIAATGVVILLAIPLLQFIGGLVLVVIAYRLAQPKGNAREIRARSTLREAVLTILVADAAMSLENILGVGAAAHGNVMLLVFGLLLSIPIVLFGSGLVVALLDRFPGAVWLGVGALAWTAADLVLGDPVVSVRAAFPWVSELLLAAVLLAGVAMARFALRPRVG